MNQFSIKFFLVFVLSLALALTADLPPTTTTTTTATDEFSTLDLTSFLSFCTAFFSDFPARTWLHIHRHARTPLRFSSELWEQLLAPRQRRRRTKENSHFSKIFAIGKIHHPSAFFLPWCSAVVGLANFLDPPRLIHHSNVTFTLFDRLLPGECLQIRETVNT